MTCALRKRWTPRWPLYLSAQAVRDSAAYLKAHPAEEVEPSARLDLKAAAALAATMYKQKIVQHDYGGMIDYLAYPNL